MQLLVRVHCGEPSYNGGYGCCPSDIISPKGLFVVLCLSRGCSSREHVHSSSTGPWTVLFTCMLPYGGHGHVDPHVTLLKHTVNIPVSGVTVRQDALALQLSCRLCVDSHRCRGHCSTLADRSRTGRAVTGVEIGKIQALTCA